MVTPSFSPPHLSSPWPITSVIRLYTFVISRVLYKWTHSVCDPWAHSFLSITPLRSRVCIIGRSSLFDNNDYQLFALDSAIHCMSPSLLARSPVDGATVNKACVVFTYRPYIWRNMTLVSLLYYHELYLPLNLTKIIVTRPSLLPQEPENGNHQYNCLLF
jgi:hypothetical protein